MSGVVSGEPGPTVAVIDSVERDWQEFQQLDYMGNHWERPGWTPGRRAYYWYITLGDTPQLEALATECQSKVNLPYLDPVPSTDCISPCSGWPLRTRSRQRRCTGASAAPAGC